MEFTKPSSTNGGSIIGYDIFSAIDINQIDTKDTPGFPFNQTPVGTATPLLEEAVIKKVFSSVTAGIKGNSSDLVSIRNDSDSYSVSVRANTSIGGTTATCPINNIVDNDLKAAQLTIPIDTVVPSETLYGTPSNPSTGNYCYIAPSAATDLSATSDSNSVTLNFKKNQDASELLITVNGETAFDTYTVSLDNAIKTGVNAGSVNMQDVSVVDDFKNNNIPFSPALFIPTYTSGLFNLQQQTGNNKTILSKYFNVVTGTDGSPYYAVKILTSIKSIFNVYYSSRVPKGTGATQVYSDAASITSSPSAPSDPVSNTSFKVLDKNIMASWSAPINIGGAGEGTNGSLLYKLSLYNTIGYPTKTAVTTISGVTSTTYTFSNLTNYTSSNNQVYYIEIIAYYNQGGDPTKPSNSISKLVNNLDTSGIAVGIRVGAGPVPFTIGTLLIDAVAGNSVTLPITNPDANSPYPISSFGVYDSQNNLLVTVPSPLLSGATANVKLIQGSLLNSNSTFLNGRLINVKIKCIANYLYAQNIPDSSVSFTPRKSITSSDMSVTTGDNKSFSVDISTHGTTTNGLVAVARSSTLQVIQQSQANNTWTPATSGVSTTIDDANLTQTCSVNFATPVTDVLFLLSQQDGITSTVFPASSVAFGMQK